MPRVICDDPSPTFMQWPTWPTCSAVLIIMGAEKSAVLRVVSLLSCFMLQQGGRITPQYIKILEGEALPTFPPLNYKFGMSKDHNYK